MFVCNTLTVFETQTLAAGIYVDFEGTRWKRNLDSFAEATALAARLNLLQHNIAKIIATAPGLGERTYQSVLPVAFDATGLQDCGFIPVHG